jgi:hypothetical protein
MDCWLLTEVISTGDRPDVFNCLRCFFYTGLNGLLSIRMAMLFCITAFVRIPSRFMLRVVCSSGEIVAELGIKQPYGWSKPL